MGVSEWYASEPRYRRPTHSSPSPKANILIDHRDHARLAGFSPLTMTPDQSTTAPSIMTGDGIQWMSPELISPSKPPLKESCPTKQSDCYALGMVIYEVLREQVPFVPPEGTAVISKFIDGECPGRPQGGEGARFTDDLWRMLEGCWKPQPDDRLSAEDVLMVLEGNPLPLKSTSGAGGGTGMDSVNRTDPGAGESSTVLPRAHP